jgi:hypothetical protein
MSSEVRTDLYIHCRLVLRELIIMVEFTRDLIFLEDLLRRKSEA